MKESGLGTPATRAATIERLIDKEYLEPRGQGAARHRPGRSALIRTLGDHAAGTRPDLTGALGEAARRDRARPRRPGRVHARHPALHDRDGRLVRRQGPHGDARRAARDRPLPALRRRDRRAAARATPAPPGSRRTSRAAATRSGSSTAAARSRPRRPRSSSPRAVSATDRCERAERTVIGPCPTPGCGGEIVERGKSFGCTSWTSRDRAGLRLRDLEAAARHAARTSRSRRRASWSPPASTNAAPRSSEPLGDVPDPGLRRQDRREQRAPSAAPRGRAARSPAAGS